MKNNVMLGVLCLMTISLFGILIFQYYWLKQTVRMNRENFHESAKRALVEVNNAFQRKNVIRQDSKNSEVYEESRDSTYLFSATSDTPFLKNKFVKGFTPDSLLESKRMKQFEQLNRTLRQDRLKNTSMRENIYIWYSQNCRSCFRQEENQAFWLRSFPLDSLLQAALKQQGLPLYYHYGIYSQQYKKWHKISAGGDTTLLGQSPLSIHLGYELLNRDQWNILYLHFPNKDTFLLNKLWLLLAGSAVLLLTIAGSYGYAIRTILRQKKLSDIKTDFINNMTHEFKTPLATISLAADAIDNQKVIYEPERVRQFTQTIRQENKRLNNHVERVLQAALLDSQDFLLKRAPTDIHELVLQAVQQMSLQVHSRAGTLRTVLVATEPVIQANKSHLFNVLINLLDNANKYSPDPPDIQVVTRNVAEGILLEVSDKGMGMTKESLKHIFEKFYRVPTGNTHNVKGFGLGLNYVHTVVEAHKGQIQVESTLHQGSQFRLFFPFG